ncbi:hypothetical protein C0J52_22587 [Blattella germanica]|nr:hypothetical protein C0J52_22587 [Blattella germanica]
MQVRAFGQPLCAQGGTVKVTSGGETTFRRRWEVIIPAADHIKPGAHLHPASVSSQQQTQHEAGYVFSFQTSDGISREEAGQLKNAGSENEAIEVRGSYTYKGVDGKDYKVEFVANENGYQPVVSARRK